MSGDTRDRARRDMFPRRSPKILWREADGNVVLFHEDNGRAFALNETATVIWKLCDGTRSTADIASQLAASFGLDAAVAREAMAELVGELSEEGCVETASRAAGEAGGPPPGRERP